MANFQRKLRELSKHGLFRYDVPFLIFVLGGSFGLKELQALGAHISPYKWAC